MAVHALSYTANLCEYNLACSASMSLLSRLGMQPRCILQPPVSVFGMRIRVLRRTHKAVPVLSVAGLIVGQERICADLACCSCISGCPATGHTVKRT